MWKLPAIASLLFACTVMAQEEAKHPYDVARTAMQARMDELRKQFFGNEDVKFFGDVMADRKNGMVELQACATGIRPTDPVEFFVSPFDSGKDYEALAVTPAKPSDVHKALEFIGLKPGRPVNFFTNHYWPRGSRVVMNFVHGNTTIRAENLILNTETKSPLTRTGLIFTGSYTRTDEAGKAHYAADEADARTIASDFNDPTAVLDIPPRAPQSTVYGFRRPSDRYTFKQGDLFRITLQAASADEAVADVDFKVIATPGSYAIAEAGKRVAEAWDLAHLVDSIAKRVDGKSDLFTHVQIADTMPIESVRKLYAVLMSVEQDRGVKLEPPAAGELFHRSFFPDEEWRSRETRLGEPWELHLTRDAGLLFARLERQVENIETGAEPRKSIERYNPKSPAEFVDLINGKQAQWTKAIFVFPPDDLTYGELKEWTSRALPTYPRIFVFTPTISTTQPAAAP